MRDTCTELQAEGEVLGIPEITYGLIQYCQ